MFQHIDDKLHSMIAALLTIGAVAMILGLVVLTNEFSLRFLTALVFFCTAYLAFFLGYKFHVLHCTIKEKLSFGFPKPLAKKKK